MVAKMTAHSILLLVLVMALIMLFTASTASSEDSPYQSSPQHQECLVYPEGTSGSSSSSEVEEQRKLFGSLEKMYVYQTLFADWLKKFNVVLNTNEEYLHRLKAFAANDQFISETNKKNLGFELGHNHFSHMTFEEWRKQLKTSKKYKKAWDERMRLETNRTKTYQPRNLVDLPKNVDWVKAGAVTHVKNQGLCGSCWAFSTVAGIEGAYFLKYGELKSFSEQNLVDCDGTDAGCDGGEMSNALEWIKENGGLCVEDEYPYISGATMSAGECMDMCKKDKKATPSSYTELEEGCDMCLVSAIAQQPVSVAIEADHREFMFYKSGVFNANCGENLDHGVTAVGYGETETGQKYYKVKNSWGHTWGMDGYILLERGSAVDPEEAHKGKCGILMGPPVFPTL